MPTKPTWNDALYRLKAAMLRTGSWKQFTPSDDVPNDWFGSPPATEAELTLHEDRIGLVLPPSYREFLLVSNGWRPFSAFVECLLPVSKIDRYRNVDPEDFSLIETSYVGDDVSDADYRDYESPMHSELIRPRYFGDSILVGATPSHTSSDIILLNPAVVNESGEWEAIFFANWIPGNTRYPSFRHMVEAFIEKELSLE